MKLRVNWGHASAQQLKRVLMDPEGDNMHLIACADEVSVRREFREAFEKAPRAPVAGTSTVVLFTEKLQVDLVFSDDIIALHVIDAFPMDSIIIPVRAGSPQEVWDAFCSSWIGVFGPPYEHPDE